MSFVLAITLSAVVHAEEPPAATPTPAPATLTVVAPPVYPEPVWPPPAETVWPADPAAPVAHTGPAGPAPAPTATATATASVSPAERAKARK